MSTALLTVFAVSLLATLAMVVYGLRVLLFRWELPRGAVIEAPPPPLPPEPTSEVQQPPPMYAAPPMAWTPPPSPAWQMPPLQSARFARGSIPPDFIETTEVGPPPVLVSDDLPPRVRSRYRR